MMLVTGARAQLGSDVVLELNKRGIKNLPIDIVELDITDSAAVSDISVLAASSPSAPLP